MSASLGAYAAIELAAGGPRDLVPGDRLYLSQSAPSAKTPALRSLLKRRQSPRRRIVAACGMA